MRAKTQKKKNKSQVKEIEVYKWLQSERARRDLGEEACKEWIQKFGASYNAKFVKNELLGKAISQIKLLNKLIASGYSNKKRLEVLSRLIVMNIKDAEESIPDKG